MLTAVRTQHGMDQKSPSALSESGVQPTKKLGMEEIKTLLGILVTVLSYWPAVDAAFHISNGLWPRVTSENTENWKPAGSLTLLVTGVSTQNSHFPQILSACPKGKPHSPSTEHSPKANPRANPSPERQSRSTVLWGGLGHVRLPTEQAQRRPQIVKHGSRLLPSSNSSLQACWVPQRVTALPFCTQGMFTLSSETLLPGHKDKMKSVRNSTAATSSAHLGFPEGNKSLFLKHHQ